MEICNLRSGPLSCIRTVHYSLDLIFSWALKDEEVQAILHSASVFDVDQISVDNFLETASILKSLFYYLNPQVNAPSSFASKPVYLRTRI